MPSKPIGVWISIAVLLLLLTGWLGYRAGIAVAWTRSRAQEQHAMSGLEPATRKRLSATLSVLSGIEMLRLSTGLTSQSSPEDLRSAAMKIQSLARQAEATGLQPVVSLNLGIAYVEIATLEERINPNEARKYMELAQPLFRDLGWRDCSQDALKTAVQRLDTSWNIKPERRSPR